MLVAGAPGRGHILPPSRPAVLCSSFLPNYPGIPLARCKNLPRVSALGGQRRSCPGIAVEIEISSIFRVAESRWSRCLGRRARRSQRPELPEGCLLPRASAGARISARAVRLAVCRAAEHPEPPSGARPARHCSVLRIWLARGLINCPVLESERRQGESAGPRRTSLIPGSIDALFRHRMSFASHLARSTPSVRGGVV